MQESYCGSSKIHKHDLRKLKKHYYIAIGPSKLHLRPLESREALIDPRSGGNQKYYYSMLRQGALLSTRA